MDAEEAARQFIRNVNEAVPDHQLEGLQTEVRMLMSEGLTLTVQTAALAEALDKKDVDLDSASGKEIAAVVAMGLKFRSYLEKITKEQADAMIVMMLEMMARDYFDKNGYEGALDCINKLKAKTGDAENAYARNLFPGIDFS